MNRNVIWKIALILAVMAVFTVAIIPTKSDPEPIKRGLDLKGGTHLVMRVNVNEAMRLEVDQAMNVLRTQAGTRGVTAPAPSAINAKPRAAFFDGMQSIAGRALGAQDDIGTGVSHHQVAKNS